MIRVAIVDHHEALRLVLYTAIRSKPGLVPVGAAANSAELAPLLYRSRPDIVLLDYNLPDADGLTVCRDIKAHPLAPGVILYSAFADSSMTVPAIVAGADGILYKADPARDLFDAIREVAHGGDALPPISPDQFDAASSALAAEDQPLLGMLVDRIPTDVIAESMLIDRTALQLRVVRMLSHLTSAIRGSESTARTSGLPS